MINAYRADGKMVEAGSTQEVISLARSDESVYMIVLNEGATNEHVAFTRNLNGTWGLEEVSDFNPARLINPNQGAFNV